MDREPRLVGEEYRHLSGKDASLCTGSGPVGPEDAAP